MADTEAPLRVRVFNTYEPGTTTYRDLIPLWTKRGWQVQVLISRRNYREGRDRPWAVDGVKVMNTPAPGGGKAGAIIGYLLFAPLKSLFAPRVDMNLFLTQPPLFFIWGYVLRLLRRQPYTILLMDLYPDVAVLDGLLKSNSLLARMLTRISRFSLCKADGVIVIGRDMAQRVSEMGVSEARIHLVSNWTDEHAIQPLDRGTNPFRLAHGWGDRLVLMYSGNIGISHWFDDFLELARRFSDREDLVIAVIGSGARKKEIETFIATHQLTNLVVLPFQDQDKLAESLSAGDVHFVSLREGFEGCVVPSKTYGILAAGRPVLYQGAASGEIARMIAESDVGVVVPQGDADALEATVKAYLAEPARAMEQGQRARALAEGSYSRATSCERFTQAIRAGVTRSSADSR
ncbi:MAG: colanic acid biosynthesis glycosyl transferase WcaI [Kiritimatiellia bacterium]|jgi:colanic acid biosynthesis glycosyl transferase WcaI